MQDAAASRLSEDAGHNTLR
jgi:hypothetical protein